MFDPETLSAAGEPHRDPWCLSFVNTVSSRHAGGTDRLQSYLDLRGALLKSGVLKETASGPEDPKMLERARRLREAIYAIGSAIAHGAPIPRDDVDELNWEVQKALVSLKVRPSSSGLQWDLGALHHTVPGGIGLLALSAATLFTSDRASRIRECHNAECGWMFLDLSKNRSRKWCDMSDCGNLEKARRHYAKKKAAGKKIEAGPRRGPASKRA